LSRVEREVTVSAFCRRRLAVIMVRTGMVETIKAVCSFFFLPFGLEKGK
jgi:U3 small nucleolar ribonucleoprotein protein IMP3